MFRNSIDMNVVSSVGSREFRDARWLYTKYTYLHIYIYIYIYMYVCIHACMYVCTYTFWTMYVKVIQFHSLPGVRCPDDSLLTYQYVYTCVYIDILCGICQRMTWPSERSLGSRIHIFKIRNLWDQECIFFHNQKSLGSSVHIFITRNLWDRYWWIDVWQICW